MLVRTWAAVTMTVVGLPAFTGRLRKNTVPAATALLSSIGPLMRNVASMSAVVRSCAAAAEGRGRNSSATTGTQSPFQARIGGRGRAGAGMRDLAKGMGLTDKVKYSRGMTCQGPGYSSFPHSLQYFPYTSVGFPQCLHAVNWPNPQNGQAAEPGGRCLPHSWHCPFAI